MTELSSACQKRADVYEASAAKYIAKRKKERLLHHRDVWLSYKERIDGFLILLEHDAKEEGR